MEKYLLFLKIQKALEKNPLIELRALTYMDLVSLDLSDDEKRNLGPYHIGMVKKLIQDAERIAEEETDEANLQGLIGQLEGSGRQWLKNRFPTSEFDNGQEVGKRFIRIWLDGKPEAG